MVVTNKEAPVVILFGGFVADLTGTRMVGLVSQEVVHGCRKIGERIRFQKIKLFQSPNKLRAFEEEEEMIKMVVLFSCQVLGVYLKLREKMDFVEDLEKKLLSVIEKGG